MKMTIEYVHNGKAKEEVFFIKNCKRIPRKTKMKDNRIEKEKR